MSKTKFIHFNVSAISKALEISEADTLKYLKDGRKVSFILEKRLCNLMGGKMAKPEAESFDFIDSEGKKWELRCITKRVFFSPSNMVGKGRSFHKDGFLEKLKAIEGYILVDINEIPMPYWKIQSKQVNEWWENGNLNKDSSMSRKKIILLLKNL